MAKDLFGIGFNLGLRFHMFSEILNPGTKGVGDVILEGMAMKSSSAFPAKPNGNRPGRAQAARVRENVTKQTSRRMGESSASATPRDAK